MSQPCNSWDWLQVPRTCDPELDKQMGGWMEVHGFRPSWYQIDDSSPFPWFPDFLIGSCLKKKVQLFNEACVAGWLNSAALTSLHQNCCFWDVTTSPLCHSVAGRCKLVRFTASALEDFDLQKRPWWLNKHLTAHPRIATLCCSGLSMLTCC